MGDLFPYENCIILLTTNVPSDPTLPGNRGYIQGYAHSSKVYHNFQRLVSVVSGMSGFLSRLFTVLVPRAFLRDEKWYPNPHVFDPSRWLTDSGNLNPNIMEPATFGSGRRNCVGRHMALSTVWIAAASILTAFNIEKAVDNKGVTVEPSMEYEQAMIR
jgi:hypothetical protein